MTRTVPKSTVMKTTVTKRSVWICWVVLGLPSAWVACTIYVQNMLDYELIAAVNRLDGSAVKTCLAKGANPNTTDPATRGPLWWQALVHLTRQKPGLGYYGDEALVVVLERCVERENAEAAKRMTGADPGRSFEPIEIVSALLDHGANPNVQIVPGELTIAYAQASGYKKCVRMLLEHGAQANGTASGGGTLLTYAIRGDDFDTVNELVKHGASVNATGASGASPLAYAMSSVSGNYPVRQRIIQLLTKSGAHM